MNRTMSLKDHVKPLSSALPLSLYYCRRCGGLMLSKALLERGFRWPGAIGERRGRCLQCGEIVDSMIPNNRLRCPSRVEIELGVRQWRLLADPTHSEGSRGGADASARRHPLRKTGLSEGIGERPVSSVTLLAGTRHLASSH